jgi:hypothetical protein
MFAADSLDLRAVTTGMIGLEIPEILLTPAGFRPRYPFEALAHVRDGHGFQQLEMANRPRGRDAKPWVRRPRHCRGKARIARPPKLQPKSEVASAELLTLLARSTSDKPVYHASQPAGVLGGANHPVGTLQRRHL